MSVTREANPSRVNVGFSLKKKARNDDWEARNLVVDIESKALVNLKKDTPHKFLSWTDIIYFERLDYAHLKIQFHSNRDYLLQVCFADDIAPLCALLGLISQWRAASKDRQKVILNAIEKFARSPVLHSGYVQKLGQGNQLGWVRHGLNKRWAVVVAGRIHFFLNHLTRYPRHCVPLGPHTRQVAMRGDCQVELELTRPCPSARPPLAPFIPGPPPSTGDLFSTQIRGGISFGPSTAGEDGTDWVKLLCTRETASNWYDMLASALNGSDLFGMEGPDCSAEAATKSSDALSGKPFGSGAPLNPSPLGTLPLPVCSNPVLGAEYSQTREEFLLDDRHSFSFSPADCDWKATKNKVDWPHFKSTQPSLDIFVSAEGEQLLFGTPPHAQTKAQQYGACGLTQAVVPKAPGGIACDSSGHDIEERINCGQSHRPYLLGSAQQLSPDVDGVVEQVMYSPRQGLSLPPPLSNSLRVATLQTALSLSSSPRATLVNLPREAGGMSSSATGGAADALLQAPYFHQRAGRPLPSSDLTGSPQSCARHVIRKTGVQETISPSLARRTLRTPPAFPPRLLHQHEQFRFRGNGNTANHASSCLHSMTHSSSAGASAAAHAPNNTPSRTKAFDNFLSDAVSPQPHHSKSLPWPPYTPPHSEYPQEMLEEYQHENTRQTGGAEETNAHQDQLTPMPSTPPPIPAPVPPAPPVPPARVPPAPPPPPAPPGSRGTPKRGSKSVPPKSGGSLMDELMKKGKSVLKKLDENESTKSSDESPTQGQFSFLKELQEKGRSGLRSVNRPRNGERGANQMDPMACLLNELAAKQKHGLRSVATSVKSPPVNSPFSLSNELATKLAKRRERMDPQMSPHERVSEADTIDETSLWTS